MTDDPKPQLESEEFISFKKAMMKIASVKKIDIVDELPKMFRERKPPTKVTKKRSTRKPPTP